MVREIRSFPPDGHGLNAAAEVEAERRAEIYREYSYADITVSLGSAETRLKMGMVEIMDPCAYCGKPQACGCEWDAVHRRANEEIDHMVATRYGI